MEEIYTLTALAHPSGYESVCIGWLPSLDAALVALTGWRGNADGLYRFVVVERVPAGLDPALAPVAWFAYDRPSGSWLACPPPAEAFGICNFAMGG